MSLCPCSSQKEFSECCEPLLKGDRAADSPESLMRSRYTAFATQNFDYIMRTTDPQARTDMDLDGTKEWMENAQFLRLEVIRAVDEGNKGVVEFKAYFKMNGSDHVHHELSKFRKLNGTWFFRDGRLISN